MSFYYGSPGALAQCGGARPECIELAARAAALEDAKEKAALNKDIYDWYDPEIEAGPLPEGITRMSTDPDAMREFLGDRSLTDSDIENLFEPDRIDPFSEKATSYRAMLYRNETTKEMTLVFRGSTGTVGISEDWIENYKQGIGMKSEHFERAKALANRISLAADIEGADLTLSGHSKGGGMAGAAALSSGVPAITFNPSGVHKNTVPGVDLSKGPSLVTDYVVEGDMLNHTIQDNRNTIRRGAAAGAAGIGNSLAGPGGGVAGYTGTMYNTRDAIPQNVGARIDLPDTTAAPRWYDVPGHASSAIGVPQHLMPAVTGGVEKEIETVRTMQRNLGCP